MMNAALAKWNDCYKDVDISTATACALLQQYEYLLPSKGHALDLACGRAGNAQLLQHKGLSVDAFDLSPNVIQAIQDYSQGAIHAQVWNSETDRLATNHYDVIVVSYFLQRNLFGDIITGLKPGGLLFYQTWSQLKIANTGPSNPGFRLQAGELLTHCKDMRIVCYSEEGTLGNIRYGNRNEACIIAEKPQISANKS